MVIFMLQPHLLFEIPYTELKKRMFSFSLTGGRTYRKINNEFLTSSAPFWHSDPGQQSRNVWGQRQALSRGPHWILHQKQELPAKWADWSNIWSRECWACFICFCFVLFCFVWCQYIALWRFSSILLHYLSTVVSCSSKLETSHAIQQIIEFPSWLSIYELLVRWWTFNTSTASFPNYLKDVK